MFLSIAKKYYDDFNEGRVCPDQNVGTIRVANGTSINPLTNQSNDDFLTRINTKVFQRTDDHIVFLIIESPHLSEFKDKSPHPAAGNRYGDTGRAIRMLLHEACDFHNHLIDGEYQLVILNAIQYQCSLGDIKKYRDKMFIDCWNSFGRNSFKNRLLKLYEVGDITINACTSGSTKPKLRELVKSTIDKLIGNTTFEIEHPSNWMREHNTAIKNGQSPNYLWKS